MPTIGPLEMLVILVVALIVLGPSRLPDAGRAIGKGLREFRHALSNPDDDEDDAHSRRSGESPGANA